MTKLLTLSLFAVAGALPFSAYAGWEDYERKTLEATITENEDMLSSSDVNYTPGLPQLVLAQYLGEQRDAPKGRERMIRGWVKSIGREAEVAELFLTEIKFEEDGKPYWLAVQHPLVRPMEEELEKGDYVWLYVVWIGTSKTDWVFVVNEFQKAIPKDQAAGSE